MLAPGTSRDDLCLKYAKDSVLTIAEIRDVILSLKTGQGYALFATPNEAVRKFLTRIKSQTMAQLKEGHQKTVHECIDEIKKILNDAIFQEKSLSAECRPIQEALHYLLERFAYANGRSIEMLSVDSDESFEECLSVSPPSSS